jgi:hypothetical protein
MDICDTFEAQHDDHCWLTVRKGEAWKIRMIFGDGKFIFLWRGIYPFVEDTVIDMSKFDYDGYCKVANEWLMRDYG